MRKLLLLAAPLALLAVSDVHAATVTGTMNVTATVASTCTNLTAATLNFGSINQNTAAVPATAAISLTCTNGTTYFVSIGGGTNVAGAQQRMKNVTTAEFLNYNIYSDALRTTTFPTTAGTLGTAPTGGTGNGTAQTVTVYGTVPAGQTLPSAGTYNDALPVTVSY